MLYVIDRVGFFDLAQLVNKSSELLVFRYSVKDLAPLRV